MYYGAATLAGLNNYRGPVIQGNRTQIDGDVYVGDSSAGVLWIGATGADSYLKGVIKEAGEFSNVGMALNDGAVWYNQAANKGNVGTDTVFNKISGTNGLIYQNALSGKVTIDSLESNALNIAYEHDKTTPEKILGGDVTIVKAENKSELNVFTDYDSNMNTDASREAVLNALAKKIYYTGYKTGEDNISGTVSIAEGLTTRSAKKYFADMSFDKTTGQGYCAKDTTVQEFTKPDAQKETEFTKAILGDRSNKKYYEDAGVYVNGKYNFTADTTMNVENNSQVAGTWLWATAAGIYSGYNQENVNLDLNGKKLNINLVTDQDTAGIAAIAANSKVEIDNAGPMSVYAESTKGSNVATLFVNGGGQLFIHNGGDDAESKILTLRGKTTNSTNGVVIKSKNGVSGERSWLKVDGLVDIEADTTDGVGMAEGLLAVASTIDVGGGRIIMSASGKNPGVSYGDNATNCAIRAYGEFVSPNTGIANVNVIKDEDTATGKAIAAGNNRTQINGNFNTVGGMGTKGTINVGLNTADSYWIGNYINGAGWGVTPGDYGVVNLFMGNGAQWKGHSKFATNLKMDSGASWEGYSINKAVAATIKNGATWYNNNTPEIGKDGLNTTLKALRGGASIAEAGFVDMTTEGVRDTSVDNYSGHTKLIYKRDADTPTTVLGGNFTVGSAEKGSYISLLTNDSGLNLNNNTVVSETLGNLANKLYYTGAMTGEDNITSFVSINDALKGDSTNKRVGSVIFDETTGQGKLDWVAEKAQTKLAYTDAITGNIDTNINYVKDGVLDIESKEYSFTKKTTNLTVDNHTIPGGPWIAAIGAAISGAAGTNTQINLNGNSMNVTGIANSHSTGIAAIDDGVVEIHNAGAMNVTANGTGQTAALFANGGGQLTIHNGDGDLEKKVLTARASASYKNNGAVIKTMNGKNGVTSKITIDGLVDVLADGVNSNEAVSAVASTIDIGGGRIEAANGAWAAIRAYGEFVSPNYGIVNFNVLKDEDGNAIGAGDNRAVVIGDVVTNGGMGTKGRISLGMKGENSYWEGNYADTRGYGVTQGQLGAVNLFMEDGAHWKGFGNGSMNVKLDGAKTNWYGFSISDGMQLSLKNGATWYNAITAEQVDQSSKHTDAKIGWLTSDNGFIDMTGSRVFTAKSSSLNGGTTADGSSSITESENGITGNVVVNNYSGNATVIYKHTKTNDGIDVIGGNFTIKNAAEGSKITLSTDNNGIDTSNPDDVQGTLNQLANKLYYLGAIDGAESNLDGYVQIAEGLTSSSAALKLGDVEFSGEDGKGSLAAGSVVTPDSKKNPAVIYGDKETAMMKGAKTAMVSNALVWRAENNDLMKRMGDLRLSEGESGIWAKYYGGKYSMDGQNTNMSVRYNAYQVGYDKEVADGWKAGVALSYDDGSSSYGTGHADLKNTSLGLYGTWTGEDGQYVDLIAKYSRLENEYDVRNLYGHKLSGDYKTWGASLSAEYGKRFEGKNGMYVDPSVELTLGRVAGKDYKAASDYLDAFGKAKDLYVHQDAFTSLIGRVGVRLGQKLDNASYFVKLAAAHEFNGDFDSSYHVEGEPDGSTSISFSDTWFEAQLGGSVKLNDNSMVYASFERSFGGDVEQKWRVDAGLRWSF